jgi:hypothetical protein
VLRPISCIATPKTRAKRLYRFRYHVFPLDIVKGTGVPFWARNQFLPNQTEKADQLSNTQFEQITPFETGNCCNADTRILRGVLLR